MTSIFNCKVGQKYPKLTTEIKIADALGNMISSFRGKKPDPQSARQRILKATTAFLTPGPMPKCEILAHIQVVCDDLTPKQVASQLCGLTRKFKQPCFGVWSL